MSEQVTVITENGQVIVNTSQRIISTLPVGWDAQTAAFGRGYTFGQPGPTIVRRAGDDADIEASILGPARKADSLKMINQIDPNDFTKVLNANSFGNFDLWTDSDGLQVYGDDYMINNITGLGYIGTSKAAAGSWEANIDAALAATDAGRSGWFMTSLNQIFSIIDLDTIGSRLLFTGQPSMFSIGAGSFFVSTTGLQFTSNAYLFNLFNNPLDDAAKTSNFIYSIARKHF